MPVKVDLKVDYSQIKDLRRRNALHLPRVREKMARDMAEFVRAEAAKRAPYDSENTKENHLRDSGHVESQGLAAKTVVFERYNTTTGQESYPNFDVAVWTHEAIYNASDPTPGVGRRYLSRAVEENPGALEGIVLSNIDQYLEELARSEGWI